MRLHATQNVVKGFRVAQRQIKADAAKEGHSWATVRRSKDALGVVIEKSGYQGPSQWRLKDIRSKDTQPSASEMSIFKQATENMHLNGNRAAKDAHRSDVSTFDGSQHIVAETCWHCQGEKRCACSACWQAGAPGECVTCKGRGQVKGALITTEEQRKSFGEPVKG